MLIVYASLLIIQVHGLLAVATSNKTVYKQAVAGSTSCQNGFEVSGQIWLGCVFPAGIQLYTINPNNITKSTRQFVVGNSNYNLGKVVYYAGNFYFHGWMAAGQTLMGKTVDPTYGGLYVLQTAMNGTYLWANTFVDSTTYLFTATVMVDPLHDLVYVGSSANGIPCTLYAVSLRNGTLRWNSRYSDVSQPVWMTIQDIYYGRTTEEMFTFGVNYGGSGPTSFSYILRKFNSSGQSQWVPTMDATWGYSSTYNQQKGEFYNLQDSWDPLYGYTLVGDADYVFATSKFNQNDTLSSLATRPISKGLMMGGTLQDGPQKILYRPSVDKFVITGAIQGNFQNGYVNKGGYDMLITQFYYNLTAEFFYLDGTAGYDSSYEPFEAFGNVIVVAGESNGQGVYNYWFDSSPIMATTGTTTSTSLTKTVTSTSVTQTLTGTILNLATSLSATNDPITTYSYIIDSSQVQSTTSSYAEVISSIQVDSTSVQMTTVAQEQDITLVHQAFTQLGQSVITSLLLKQNKPDPLLSSSLMGINLIIIGAGAGGLVLLCLIVAICCINRRRSSSRSKGKTQTTPRMQFNSTEYSAVTETNVIGPTALATYLVTSHEMSVPAYLLRDFGIDFRIGAQINRGGGGSIHACQILDQRKFPQRIQFIVKVMKQNVADMSDREKDAFYNEVALLNMLRDQPQFARMHAYSERPASIVMTLYSLGSLQQFITKPSQYPYTPRQLMHLIREFSVGLSFLHSKGFMHSDVKPDNVLVELGQHGLLEPRITDFGITRQVDGQSLVQAFKFNSIKGLSVVFASPEAFQNFHDKQYQLIQPKASDVYSTGVMLFEMLVRQGAWKSQAWPAVLATSATGK